MVALRGFLKELFLWEWQSVPFNLAVVRCLVALREHVAGRFDYNCEEVSSLMCLQIVSDSVLQTIRMLKPRNLEN